MSSRRAKILWIDLEMTGLSHKDDLILEVAIIATDWKFKEIDTYTGVVKHSRVVIKKKLAKNNEFWDQNPETRDALLDQNNSGKTCEEIEEEILAFIKKNFAQSKKILAAGNSVHVDRRFIAEKWPKFDEILHYRMLDVSAWKVVFEGKYKKKFAKSGTHRALDDIRGSIEELQYYLAKFK